jgi:sulfur carrier protein ThiS adenylyltransferase
MSLNHQDFLRYSRQLMAADMGEEAQEKLKSSTGVVVGLGGLGCPASLYLAAAGVGKLVLIDGDAIELSNLQRQILFRDSDIGKYKAKVAAKRLQKLDSNLQTEVLLENIDRQGLIGLLDDTNLVLDCTDNMATRQEINRAAVAYKKPLISAAAMGWEGQLLEVRNDIESAACLACAYGIDQDESIMNCETAGVMGPVLGVMGSMQALRAIQIITGNNPRGKSKLARFDGKSGEWVNFGLAAKTDCAVCS